MSVLPKISIGCHALRELPFLDISPEKFREIVERRLPPGIGFAQARIVFLCEAIRRGHRNICVWTLMDVLPSLGWTEWDMAQRARAPYMAMQPVEPPF